MQCNFLLLSVGLSIIAGSLCLFLPDRFKFIARASSIITAAITFSISILIFLNKPLSFSVYNYTIFAADNLSAFIGIAISFFAVVVSLYSIEHIDKAYGRYFGYLLITLGSSLGVAFANDFITLLVFWGILAVMLYLLVNISNTKNAATAAKKALIIIGGTDAIMMFGICLIRSLTGSFSFSGIHLELNGAVPIIAYFSIAIACFAKAGAMPFHSWLPDVAQEAPAPVTAYLPASLDKLLGIYLLARASLDLFIMNKMSNLILLIVGSITIVLAVIIALVQHDMKRLLGYHAVSQVGYMVLGIGTGNPIGIAGGIFHMMNHAVYKSCLFLSGGNVEKSTGTSDLSKLGGLAGYMPVTFASFLIASLSISGIPPFNGFVSKWMVYQGIIEMAGPKNPLWMVWLASAMFGSALTVASFMKLIHAVFLGRPSKGMAGSKEAGFLAFLAVAILAATCFTLGVFAFVFPLPLFIMPSVGAPLIYLGLWSPVAATILIMAGIAAGIFSYYVFRPGAFRVSDAFVGGEDPESFERLSGTEFYDTIKDVRGLKIIYKKEDEGVLDIYNIGKRGIYFFTNIFQRLHNGILPTYLVWCLLGMIVMFVILFLKAG